ncbi:MAG TPA: ABC transporter permease [Trebonia sp.]|jgi:ribose transport system permease protein|nr:ABC transporter permease [Trebonia sp.]
MSLAREKEEEIAVLTGESLPKSRAQRAVEACLRWQVASVLVALVVLLVIFSIDNHQAFDTVANFRNIALSGVETMLLGVGLTFVLVSGHIDLSVGSVLVFSSVVSAEFMQNRADSWGTVLLGLVLAVVAGLLWGILNGILVARLELSSLIITLGTLGAAQGAAEVLANGSDIATVPAKLNDTIGVGQWLGIPYLLWIVAAIVVVAGVVLSKTRFGSRTYAIGSNAEASRRAGIPVNRHEVVVFAICGGLAGVAGFLSLAQFGTTSIAGNGADNLQAITAVILGGVSLFGGVGIMFGTVIGVTIPAVLTNGFTIQGLSASWQEVAVGVVLIIAIYLDRLRRKRRSSA